MFELEVWQAPITDNQGNILPGAQITVFNSDDTVATIYDDLDRTPRTNPFNVGTDALARFYAEPGRYRVQAQSGSDIAVYDNVDLSQKAHRDDLASPDSESLIAGKPAKDIASLRDDLAQMGSEALISGVEAKEFARLNRLPIAGTFESGFTITDKGQFAIFKGAEADGSYIFRWDGALPKEVPADSAPETTGGVDAGAWVDVGQAALRSDLDKNRLQGIAYTLPDLNDLASIDPEALTDGKQFIVADGNQFKLFLWSASKGDFTELPNAGFGAKADDYIHVRHKLLSQKVFNGSSSLGTIPSGLGIGDSIMQGTGAGGIENTIVRVVGSKLREFRGVGTNNEWSAVGRGVGGSTVEVPLSYISDNSDNPDNVPVSGVTTSGLDYCLLMTLRNDATDYSGNPQLFADMFRLSIQMLNNKNIETIYITPPPKLDMATGEIIDTQENFGVVYDHALSVCGSEKATLVDAWAYFKELHDRGVDIRIYSNDGVHPNEDGYEIIAEMVFRAMIAPSITSSANTSPQLAVEFPDAITRYNADGGSVTSPTSVSGIVTGSTARRMQTGESDFKAFLLSDGDTISFDSPAPAQGVIVHMLGGASGHVSAAYNFVNLGPTFNGNPSLVRESNKVARFSKGVPPHGFRGTLTLTSSGDTRVLGVTFLCERMSSSFGRWIDADESGSWSDGALASGAVAKESAVIGDSVDLYVYGSVLEMFYFRSVSAGKFTYSVNGGQSVEVDCYLNAPPRDRNLIINMGDTTRWNTVKISVTEKNPDSNGNVVKFGLFRRFLSVGSPSIDYIPIDSEISNVSEDYRVTHTLSEIVKNIEGAGFAFNDKPDKQRFTVNGIGKFLVKVAR